MFMFLCCLVATTSIAFIGSNYMVSMYTEKCKWSYLDGMLNSKHSSRSCYLGGEKNPRKGWVGGGRQCVLVMQNKTQQATLCTQLKNPLQLTLLHGM